MGLLEVNTGLVVWTAITFVLLIIVLRLFAWKPLLEGLQNREARIREAVEGAESAREEAEKLLKEHRRLIAESETRAKEIIDEGRRDAEVLKNQIVEEARDEASKAVERAKREIELEKDKAVTTIKEQTVEMVLFAASKVIEKSLNEQDHRRLIEDSLSELGKV